jgi:hypothetical protein
MHPRHLGSRRRIPLPGGPVRSLEDQNHHPQASRSAGPPPGCRPDAPLRTACRMRGRSCSSRSGDESAGSARGRPEARRGCCCPPPDHGSEALPRPSAGGLHRPFRPAVAFLSGRRTSLGLLARRRGRGVVAAGDGCGGVEGPPRSPSGGDARRAEVSRCIGLHMVTDQARQRSANSLKATHNGLDTNEQANKWRRETIP